MKSSYGINILSDKKIMLPVMTGLLIYGYIYFSFLSPDTFVLAGRDLFIFWDGMYRMAQGQIPHVDFSSQLGFLNFLGPSLVMRLTANKIFALPVYMFCISLIITLSYFVLTHDSADTFITRTAGLITIIFIGLSLVKLDYHGGMTFHGYYRRIAAAIFVSITIFSLRDQQSGSSIVRTIINAFVLAFFGYMLLFTKITYFIGALLVLSVSSSLNPDIRKQTIVSMAFFVIALLITEIVFPGLLRGYIHDLVTALKVSSTRNEGWGKELNRLFLYKKHALALILGFIPLAGVYSFQPGSPHKAKTKLLVCSASVVIAWLIIVEYDGGHPNWEGILGVPLAAMFIFERHFTSQKKTPYLKLMLILIPSLVLILPRVYQSVNDFDKYRIIAEKRSYAWSETIKLAASKEVPDHHDKSNILEYIESGKDAIDKILRDQRNVRLYVFDLANPFSFLFSLEPPKGCRLWIHAGLNISEAQKPDFLHLIGNATHVMVPKKPIWKNAAVFLEKNYMESLTTSAEKIYENDSWTIWRLKRYEKAGDKMPPLEHSLTRSARHAGAR